MVSTLNTRIISDTHRQQEKSIEIDILPMCSVKVHHKYLVAQDQTCLGGHDVSWTKWANKNSEETTTPGTF